MKTHTFTTILLLSVLGTACASDNPTHHSPEAVPSTEQEPIWKADAEGSAFTTSLAVRAGESVGLTFVGCGALGYANARIATALKEDSLALSTSQTFCRKIARGESSLTIEIPAYAPGPSLAAGCRLERKPC